LQASEVGLAEARRQIDMCIDAGVNLIDTADVYSNGASEEIVGEIAAEHSVSAAQVALAWTLGRPAVASVVIGGRNEAQLRDNLGAANLTLTAAQRARLDTASAPPLLYPYWHQVQTAHDRLGPADLSLLAPHLKA
jgi:aryl-alcohol dehydrogenase-like predicted oxidoreductase